MKLYYFKGKKRNFGDDLNAWIWDRLLPDVFDNNDSQMMSGIGTLIGNNMSTKAKWIVLGSGIGYLPPPPDFGGLRWDILCVRGPLSAEVLGLPPEKAITDGAIYLSLLPEYAPLSEPERYGIVFMPHHQAMITGKWREACELAGIEFLDPEDDDRKTLERLRSAKLVIADAMHAAIVADTLRVPWVPVATSSEINTFKWLDWTLSMGLSYKPLALHASSKQEAFRSWALPIRAESHFIKEGTRDAALQHFKRMQRLKSQAWWPLYRKATGLAYYIGKYALMLHDHAKHFLALHIFRSANKPDADLLRAAEALRAATQATPYLSSIDIFEMRKQQMVACLENLRNLAKVHTE